MNGKNGKMNILQYSKSMDKNMKMINNNRNLKELLQDFNNINNNILKYRQIENLLKYTSTKDFEKESNDKIIEKSPLLEDMKLLQKRLYKSKLSKNKNNIRIYKNNVKEIMKDIFGKSDTQKKNRYYPKSKVKLKDIKNINNLELNFSDNLNKIEKIDKTSSKKNICVTERNINNYRTKKNIMRNNTLENEKNININYMDYASNCVKYKHPQFYLLNTNNIIKKQLPPINLNKINMVDLFHKNSSFLKKYDKKRSKFEKYMIALQMGEIAKFKVND